MPTPRRPWPIDFRHAGLAFGLAMPLATMLGCELILPPPGYYVAASGAGGNGGTGGGASSGGAAASGGGDSGSCCTGSLTDHCVGYHIVYATDDPTIDGDCTSDPVWATAPEIAFTGASASFPEKMYSCRLAWSMTGGGTLFGCCQVKDDSDLTAGASAMSQNAIRSDDGFEYILGGSRTFGSGVTDVYVNIKDMSLIATSPDGGLFDSGQVKVKAIVSGTINDDAGPPDQGYSIEWSASTPNSGAGGLTFCQFSLHDRSTRQIDDAGTVATSAKNACGTSDKDPLSWTICQFEPMP